MQAHGPDEAGLAEGISRGDLAALGRIYDKYAARLYAYTRSLGASPSLAEDVLQEVFVKLMRRSACAGPVTSLREYLFAAARHEFYRWSTRLFRARGTNPAAFEGLLEVADPGAPGDEAAAVEEALSKLPRAQREVVMMKVYGDLTFAQIARVMETSTNTAASRYRYAIEKLKSLLG